MGTQIVLTSPNYSGYVADITFYAQTGGTISLGSHLTPYTADLDYFYGTYELCYSAFGFCCSTTIVAPTPTPTNTPTNTQTPSVTPTNTTTPTTTTTRTPTPTTTTTLTSTPTNTQTPTMTQTPTNTATQTTTPTRTPTNTPTQTPTVSQVWYYYQLRNFACDNPGACEESITINYTKSKIPLSNGYYCDVISTACIGLRIIGTTTPNFAYNEWEYSRYPVRDSGVCSQGLCD
jgi:hypothetical protein